MIREPRPPVAILCGGRGTRLQERTAEIPKPLVEIGGRPILEHVIALYAAQGFRRFLLATGYRGELIARFAAAPRWPEDVVVECHDTDGLADIDLAELLAFHDAHGALATMTVVRPELQFGVTELDDADGRVLGFREKPRSEHWINGGFFCLRPGVFAHLRADSVLERAPLEALAAAGELRAYRHAGFWECMDTYKDAVALNDLWASGEAPWRVPRILGVPGRA
jgi:glucose-1-phosphate cytidylyltransferase